MTNSKRRPRKVVRNRVLASVSALLMAGGFLAVDVADDIVDDEAPVALACGYLPEDLPNYPECIPISVCRDGQVIEILPAERLDTDTEPPCPVETTTTTTEATTTTVADTTTTVAKPKASISLQINTPECGIVTYTVEFSVEGTYGSVVPSRAAWAVGTSEPSQVPFGVNVPSPQTGSLAAFAPGQLVNVHAQVTAFTSGFEYSSVADTTKQTTIPPVCEQTTTTTAPPVTTTTAASAKVSVCRDGVVIEINANERLETDTEPPCPAVTTTTQPAGTTTTTQPTGTTTTTAAPAKVSVCRDGVVIEINANERLETDTEPPCPLQTVVVDTPDTPKDDGLPETGITDNGSSGSNDGGLAIWAIVLGLAGFGYFGRDDLSKLIRKVKS